MRKVLITGIAGFAGSHLAERLHGKAEVWGIAIDANIGNLSGIPGIRTVECDLLDREKVIGIVGGLKPDIIFHLAGQSNPAVSFSSPGETLNVNIFSSLNIFESVIKASPATIVLNVCSGDEYGDAAPAELPVRETSELRPLNPYAVSKVASDLLAYQYWKASGLKAVRCRPFNHFGQRQSESFVTSSFAMQIAEIEAGIRRERVLKVGNLDAAKDFLDVRDVVYAYEVLSERGEYGGVYNISSGRAVKIREVLDILLSFSSGKIEVVTDSARLRSSDTSAIYGDSSRLRGLGWEPRIRLEDGLRDLLDFWRGRVGGAASAR